MASIIREAPAVADPFDVSRAELWSEDRWQQPMAQLRAAMPASHRAFLDGLALSHRSGDYVFAHAGIRPRVPVERQDPEDLMWIRREFLGAEEFGGLCVVHGHSQVTEAVDLPHRIGVDTGAYHSGRLTCAVIEDGRRRFLSTAE